MTKKKNIASKLVLVLFVLTLISCCLLGSTFARYVSGGTGSASVGIAKWDVDITNSDSTTATFGSLSPSKDAFSDTAARSHKTKKVQVASITNNGDVSAIVTVASGTIVLNLGYTAEGAQYSFATDKAYTTENAESVQFDPNYGASKEQAEGLFTIALYQGENAEAATKITDAITLNADGGSVKIWAELTWTSADKMSNQATNAAYADAIDTWVGAHVASVSCDITYTAVQGSELPNA